MKTKAGTHLLPSLLFVKDLDVPLARPSGEAFAAGATSVLSWLACASSGTRAAPEALIAECLPKRCDFALRKLKKRLLFSLVSRGVTVSRCRMAMHKRVWLRGGCMYYVPSEGVALHIYGCMCFVHLRGCGSAHVWVHVLCARERVWLRDGCMYCVHVRGCGSAHVWVHVLCARERAWLRSGCMRFVHVCVRVCIFFYV